MYLLIVYFPLAGSLISGGAGRFIGGRGAAVITTSCVGGSLLASLLGFYEVALSGSLLSLKLSPWFTTELFYTPWGFYFDSLTTVMLLVVTGVSFCVHLYSISYMSGDPHIPRFFSYLSIFTFFMLFLVTSDNFLGLFFGWEGVGLASYLLISFWFTRLRASKGSIKAMLLNRIGDMGLALGIMGIYSITKDFSYGGVFALVPEYAGTRIVWCNMEVSALFVICILFFIGACGKSAQLGLHIWLPDAMEGPTPVSALIHAATMVTAGVFLICRAGPLFSWSPEAQIILCVLGASTSFFAATCGAVQNDIKRVVAYSTCSQLGYMVFAAGLSAPHIAIFHLVNHAFFKALLFLSAGSIIHSLSDQQDMRKMGGLCKALPCTYGTVLIGSLSLAGFPFLTGFYSKDMILEYAATVYTFTGNFSYWCGLVVVGGTSYYSFRLLVLTFFGKSRTNPSSLKNMAEAPGLMALPLCFLALLSVYGGFVLSDMMIGIGCNFWGNSLLFPQTSFFAVEQAYISQNIKYLPGYLTIFGIFSALFIFNGKESFRLSLYKKGLSFLSRTLYSLGSKRWFMDPVYNGQVGYKLLTFGYNISWKTIDKGFLEAFGPKGIRESFPVFSRNLSGLQSGILYHYAVTMLLGLIFGLSFVALWTYFQPFYAGKYPILYFCTFLLYRKRRGELS